MPAHWWLELGLVPLVDEAMLRGVLMGGCELSVAWGTLSTDGWGCVPVLLVVWPETLTWVGPGLDAKMVTVRRAHTCQCSLGLLPLELLFLPHCESQWVSSSHGVPVLCWVPVYMKPCMHPARVKSVSSSPAGLHSSPTGLQRQMLWEFLLLMPDVGEPLWYNFFFFFS